MKQNHVLMALIVLAIASPLAAADFNDPDWPCVQRKVDEISLGQMWPYPLEGEESVDENGQELIAILSQRRVSQEDAQGYVRDYFAAHQPDQNTLTAIYARLLRTINHERARLISGIERYAKGQQQRAENIDAKRLKMSEEEAKADPDFDHLDALEREIDWDERIYKDRERALTYVCETPVLLEKRAYMLAQVFIRASE